MSGVSKRKILTQLTLFAEDSLAKISPQQAIVRAWLEANQGCGGSSTVLWPGSVPPGLSLKTSLECCRRAEDGTWVPSSGRWGTWGIGGPTECWTLNGSDCPSDARESLLLDILETGPPPQKYYLSPKTAQGILRMAAMRGKIANLPEPLRRALQDLASFV